MAEKKERKRSGLSRKLKVSSLDIHINSAGLRVYDYKVPSYGYIKKF